MRNNKDERVPTALQLRCARFMAHYEQSLMDKPDAKHYRCYLDAEAKMQAEEGRRQYKSYEVFRAARSRWQRKKRKAATLHSAAANPKTVLKQG